MTNTSTLHATDFYKTGHREQYPDNTTLVYANLTPRSDKLAGPYSNGHVVWFGLQHYLKQLRDTWDRDFFQQPVEQILSQYKRRLDTSLGGDHSVDHIRQLHDVGYLPLHIKALPEGTLVPMRVPVMTIYNTIPHTFWLTNYLETKLSQALWKPTTNATTAYLYRTLFDHHAVLTGTDPQFVPFQGHDFSMRGMSPGWDDALSGAGHLLSFVGTDTIPAIDLLEDYYRADADRELIGCSVSASEHSVMSAGGQDDEIGTFHRLITHVYPKGIVSIVSDTWDFWQVMTTFVHKLKSTILTRDGKVVFRPDSSDPVKIICGDPSTPVGSPEHKGAVECLWDVFGGTTTSTGHRLLDPHVGLIYGDSITLQRAEAILSGLAAKGFASGNVVMGIGSFTYQYCTRDTYGFAVKATYCEINGEGREIYKSPKTGDGMKTSARGLLKVVRDSSGQLTLVDRCGSMDEPDDVMRTVFLNGQLTVDDSLSCIRSRIQESRNR